MSAGATRTETPAQSDSLWRHGPFLRLWAGQTVSLIGSQVTSLALPLTAVLALRASAFQMGVLRAVQYAPALLIGLFAGVYIDRRRRRPILMGADIGRALLLGSIPVAAALSALSMGYLDGVAFLVGCLSVIFEAAYLAFLPALVGRRRLVDANGKLEASQSVSRVMGPGLAGVLVQLLTAPVAIIADAVSFLVSVVFLGLISVDEPRPQPTQRAVRVEIGEGLRFVLGHPLLRATLMSSGVTNFFSAIFNALFVLYAVRRLGLDAASLGGIFLVGGVVGLCAAMAAGRLARRAGIGPVMALGMLLLTSGGVVMVAVSAGGALTVISLACAEALSAAGDAFYNVTVVSLRQALTPDRLLGRVGASTRFVVWGAQPFGALLAGALGESLGLRPTLAIAVAGWFLAFLTLIASPIRGLRGPLTPHGSEPEPSDEPLTPPIGQ